MTQEEFDALTAKLIDASERYYTNGKIPSMSDMEYDLLLNSLDEAVSINPKLSTPDYQALVDAVASGVGLGDSTKKVKHHKPMLSLNKANSIGEIIKYFDDTSKYGALNRGWNLQVKLDGVAISLVYKDGELAQIATRGDGISGEDVTDIVFSDEINVKNIPFKINNQKISQFNRFEVRGEMVILDDDFRTFCNYISSQNDILLQEEAIKEAEILQHNQDIHNGIKTGKLRKFTSKKPKDLPANPRNTVAGILGRVNHSQFPNEYVILDLETTGLGFKTDRIIEFAGIKYRNHQEVDRLQILINPLMPLSPIISNLTGITDDDLINKGDFLSVSKLILEFIGDCHLIGHNIDKFDMLFLKEEFRRIGISLTNETFDTLSLSRSVDYPYRIHSLGVACKRYGIVNEREHRALEDVEATYKLLQALLSKQSSNALNLSFIVYTVEGDDSADEDFERILTDEGFVFAVSLTDKYLKEHNQCAYVNNLDDLVNAVNEFASIRKSEHFSLPTDGIVIKCNEDKKISELMGNTSHHPRSQIAYKYPPSSKETTIKKIDLQVGRTGRISFVANFDEISLDGSKVKKATLHNASWLSERDVREGSVVTIVKANDIIPYVEAVVRNPQNTTVYELPSKCPLCQTILDKRTLLWRCPNDFCQSRGVEALKIAVSRKYLDIDSLSTETLYDLQISGLVNDLGDIFALSKDDLANIVLHEEVKDSNQNSVWIQRMRKSTKEDNVELDEVPRTLGMKTALTIYQSIERAKSAPLERILASLNIPNLGLEAAKNLVTHFGDIDSILDAHISDFMTVDLVSDIKAKQFYDGFKMRKDLIDKMRANGVMFKSDKKHISDILQNKTVVISGSIEGYNRDEAHNLIESLGGKTSSSVSSKTTFVIADPNSSSSKVKKAHELNIDIITPENFINRYLHNIEIV